MPVTVQMAWRGLPLPCSWTTAAGFGLLLILLVLGLVLGLGDSSSALLRMTGPRSPARRIGGGFCLLAHIVHTGRASSDVERTGLVLMWSLFASDFDAVEWCVIVSRGALGISCGFVVVSPRVGLVRGRFGRTALSHGGRHRPST